MALHTKKVSMEVFPSPSMTAEPPFLKDCQNCIVKQPLTYANKKTLSLQPSLKTYETYLKALPG